MAILFGIILITNTSVCFTIMLQRWRIYQSLSLIIVILQKLQNVISHFIRYNYAKKLWLHQKNLNQIHLLPFYPSFIMNKSVLEQLRGKELNIFSFIDYLTASNDRKKLVKYFLRSLVFS